MLTARAPDGVVTSYDYDPVTGQLARVSAPGGSTEISYYLPHEAGAGREKSRGSIRVSSRISLFLFPDFLQIR